MRAVVQRHLAQLVRPLDVVLHPRKAVLAMDFEKLDAEIGQLFTAIQKGRGR
jgi:ribonuclease P protein component